MEGIFLQEVSLQTSLLPEQLSDMALGVGLLLLVSRLGAYENGAVEQTQLGNCADRQATSTQARLSSLVRRVWKKRAPPKRKDLPGTFI